MIDFTPLQRIIIINNESKTDADDLFKLYVHNSQTLYIYISISRICSVHARHFSFFLSFFASLKLNVVFHFVHSASSASLSLPRRAFHPVPPLETPSLSTLRSPHVQSHMHYFACLAIWVFRRKGQKINVDRAVISVQATGSFSPQKYRRLAFSHLPLWFSILSMKIYAESLLSSALRRWLGVKSGFEYNVGLCFNSYNMHNSPFGGKMFS